MAPYSSLATASRSSKAFHFFRFGQPVLVKFCGVWPAAKCVRARRRSAHMPLLILSSRLYRAEINYHRATLRGPKASPKMDSIIARHVDCLSVIAGGKGSLSSKAVLLSLIFVDLIISEDLQSCAPRNWLRLLASGLLDTSLRWPFRPHPFHSQCRPKRLWSELGRGGGRRILHFCSSQNE